MVGLNQVLLAGLERKHASLCDFIRDVLIIIRLASTRLPLNLRLIRAGLYAVTVAISFWVSNIIGMGIAVLGKR